MLESQSEILTTSVAESWPFEIFKMAAGRHLGFDATGNSAVRSADLENPTLEPNRKWIGQPVVPCKLSVMLVMLVLLYYIIVMTIIII